MNNLQKRSLLRLRWMHRLFDPCGLMLSDGSAVEIVEAGYVADTGSKGADFHGASLRVVDTGVMLYGSIRIDAVSSDWRESGEMSDPSSESVVLHVVGEQDRVLVRGNHPVRTLVLPVAQELEELFENILADPVGAERCVPFYSGLEQIERGQILSRLMADRLRRKAGEVLDICRSVNRDWEETAYICFLRSLGMGDKKRSYEALARSLPYRYILKCYGDTQQIEALLMGQSGYLTVQGDSPDAYTRQLQDIYLELKKEYGLKRPVVMWGGRSGGPVRPVSLPPVMLATAAHLLGREPQLFARVLSCATGGGDLAQLRELFRSQTSDYWREQHLQSEKRFTHSGSFSDQKIDLRIINFVIPLITARGTEAGDENLREWALALYEEVAPEENLYIRRWEAGGVPARNAFDSQALIQLATEYCAPKRCGECPVGTLRLVREGKEPARRGG